MLAIAKPRPDTIEEDASEESSDEVEETGRHILIHDGIKKSDSLSTADLLGSISARNRRREKQPVSGGHMSWFAE